MTQSFESLSPLEQAALKDHFTEKYFSADPSTRGERDSWVKSHAQELVKTNFKDAIEITRAYAEQSLADRCSVVCPMPGVDETDRSHYIR
jgi:hypothetical protein